jgi:O-antigen/teichoic acid export membrane protein
MTENLRGLSSDVVIYGFGRIAVQALAFVTLPIFTRIFSVEEYGVIETVGTLAAIMGLISSLSLEAASQRSYFDYRPTELQARQAILSTAFWTLLVWSGTLAIVGALASGRIARLLFGHTRYPLLVLIVIITVPISILTNFFQEILRLGRQPIRYSIVSLMVAISGIGLALYFVIVQKWGLLGNYTGLLLGSFAGIALGLGFAHSAIRLTFDWRQLRVMLAYSLPFLPVAAFTWIMQSIDRFFLLHYAPLSQVGLYGLGVRLSNLLLLGVNAFGLAWSPFILSLYIHDPAQEKLVRARALTYVTLLLSFAAVCISIFAREFFLTITSRSFEDAYKVVGLLSGSIVAIGISSVTMTGISLSRRTTYFAQYTFLTAVLNIGLNFLLIPSLGMVGAAVATLLSYLSLGLLYYRRAQILDPAPYNGRYLSIIIGTAAVFITLGTVIKPDSIWLSIGMKIPLVVMFPLLMWHFDIIDSQMQGLLRTFCQRAWTQAKDVW